MLYVYWNVGKVAHLGKHMLFGVVSVGVNTRIFTFFVR